MMVSEFVRRFISDFNLHILSSSKELDDMSEALQMAVKLEELYQEYIITTGSRKNPVKGSSSVNKTKRKETKTKQLKILREKMHRWSRAWKVPIKR